jgi:hypothetical protein
MKRATPSRLALACLAAVSFLATAAALRAFLPWPTEGSLDARWRHFRAHAADYDLVFVGSSNMARSFDPVVFDAELARRGVALASYNLAADNMQITEAEFVLRRAIAQPGARLRFAVIEMVAFAPQGMLRDSAFTERALYWHDARATAQAIARLLRADLALGERARVAWLHGRHAAWRAANLGRAERAVAAARDAPDPRDLAVAQAGGFEALDDRPDPAAERVRARFLADPHGYAASLEQVDVRNRVPTPAPEALRAELHALAARLRAAGVEPIFVVPPLPAPSAALFSVFDEPGAPAVVALNSPGRHPELYAVESRYDATHVNRAGAALASRALAGELAERLARAPR